MKFCPSCGNPVPDGVKFCQKCGKPLPAMPSAPAAPAPRPAPAQSAASAAHPWPRKEKQKSSHFIAIIAVFVLLFAAIIFAVLIGTHVICLSHDYSEPTCTEPAACTKCGRTKGEPLGHDWLDATCTEPRTCSRCGETDGLPLGHEWADATCTEPKTCLDCGATEGEPLGHDFADGVCTRCGAELRESGFNDSGFDCSKVGTDGTPVTFTYACGLVNEDKAESPTTVTAEAEDASDIDVSDFGIDPIDGYTLYKMTITVDYDEGYDGKSYYVSSAILDYYDPEQCAETVTDLENTTYQGDTLWRYTYDIGYNDTTMTAYVFARAVLRDSSRVLTRYVYLPTGYDGFMIGLYNYANLGKGADKTDFFYDIADEDTVFLRLVP